jgi:hypothetical protein
VEEVIHEFLDPKVLPFLDPKILPGVFLFTVVLFLLQCLRSGSQYLRNGGAADRVAQAKNKTISNLLGLAGSSITAIIFWLIAGPTTDQILVGISGGALFQAGRRASLSSTGVSTAVAVYSAWWMPKAERTAHCQDIRYALRQTGWIRRSSHAWGVLKSSPRVGLRARRHHKRLAAAATGSPARTRISS